MRNCDIKGHVRVALTVIILRPCVPTYLFRISGIDDDLCSTPAKTVGDMPPVVAAKVEWSVVVFIVRKNWMSVLLVWLLNQN